MTLLSAMGWTGSLLLLIGAVKIAHRERAGFLVGGVGELLWTAKAALTEQPDLLAICLVFDCVYVYSWIKWRKPNDYNRELPDVF